MIFYMFRFVLVFYFFSFSALAKTQVKASVDPSVVSPHDTLTLTLEVEHGLRENVGSPRLPKISAFYLIGGTQVQNFHIIGRSMGGVKKYIYTLQPVKEGKFNIGSIEIVVGGKVYKTSPLEVEVSSKVKPRPTPSPFRIFKKYFPPSFFGEEDEEEGAPFFQPQQKPLQEEDVFVKLKMEKTILYLGEMILAEWFFYLPGGRSVNTRSEITKSAKLDGFWVESVVSAANSSTMSPKLEKIGEKMYRKQLLTSSALFPVRTGTLNIGALEVKSRFMNPFSVFGSSRILVKESDAEQIKVLPLPNEGKGIFFTEAVGDFNVSIDVNKKIVSVQEPMIYKVIFKGTGHPRLIRLPDLNFGDSFEVYDITESQEFSFSESVKIFEVILIPKSTGELLIPSFELTTFDPDLGIYKTHVLPEVKVKVAGVSVPVHSADKSKLYFDSDTDAEKTKEAEVKEGAIDEIRISPLMKETTSGFFIERRKYFWVVIYGLLLIFFLIALVKNFLFSRKENSSFKVKLKAGLKRVDQAIQKKQWKESGIELNQLMYSFFSDMSGQGKIVKNWDVLLQNINPSIRVKYESKIRYLASYLEPLSFASVEEARELRNKQSVEKLKKDLVDLIQKISSEYSID